MRTRTTILSVYGPVLMAAMLILTIAPTCVMPSCSGVAVASPSSCSQPVTSQFKSACPLDDGPAPSVPSRPCDEGTSDCDTSMTHGTPAAVTADKASVPDVSPVAALNVISDVAVDSLVVSTVQVHDAHPPDPLGVRLTV